jgi:hypothetical protein
LAEKRLGFYRKRSEEMRGGDYFKAPKGGEKPAGAEKPAATDLKAKYGLE